MLDTIDETQDANATLKHVYRLLPNFAFAECIVNLILYTRPSTFGPAQEIWSWKVTGDPLLMLALEIPIYFGIVMLIEYVLATPEALQFVSEIGYRVSRLCACCASSEDETDAAAAAADHVTEEDLTEGLDDLATLAGPEAEDEDVALERARVSALSYEAMANARAGAKTQRGVPDSKVPVILDGLRKVFSEVGKKDKTAVHNLSFAVERGECFGFLGINGAGKSTTLRMLTADHLPTQGTAWLNGLNLMTEQEKVRQYIGYCPQFDALLPTLTARETLELYARLKNVLPLCAVLLVSCSCGLQTVLVFLSELSPGGRCDWGFAHGADLCVSRACAHTALCEPPSLSHAHPHTHVRYRKRRWGCTSVACSRCCHCRPTPISHAEAIRVATSANSRSASPSWAVPRSSFWTNPRPAWTQRRGGFCGGSFNAL